MPDSWRWLRPIPEDTLATSHGNGTPSSSSAGDRYPPGLQDRGTASGEEQRNRVRSVLDSIINGTYSPTGGVVTGADVPEDSIDATPDVQDPTAGELYGNSNNQDPIVATPSVQIPSAGELYGNSGNLCLCGLDLAACGACGRGWAQRRAEEPDGGPIPEVPEPVFWSTEPLRCEGCLELMPPSYELGLPEWNEKLPRSHKYALLGKPSLPCFPRGVRESVRWHLDNPGKRPRTTRWWCIACNYQNVQDRLDFQANWSWRNRQEGNGMYYRTIEELAVNQFFWPRHVEFPPSELATMVWPEADETIS